jgi:hypothetical protein
VPLNQAAGRLNGCVGRNLDGGSRGLLKATIKVEVFLAHITFYAAFVGSCLLTFWDSLSVPPSRVRQSILFGTGESIEGGTNRLSQNIIQQLLVNTA